jgi:hypothetical protein
MMAMRYQISAIKPTAEAAASAAALVLGGLLLLIAP